MKNVIKKNVRTPLFLFVCMIGGIISSILVPGIISKVNFLGGIYLKLMEMCVYPLVFLSIVCSSFSVRTLLKCKETKIYFFYWFTCSGILALVGSLLACFSHVSPFTNSNLDLYKGSSKISIKEMIVNAIPGNIVATFLENNILQVIVLAFLVSIAIRKLSDRDKNRIEKGINLLYELQKCIIGVIISALPFGVFFLTSKILLENKVEMISGILQMIFIIYIGYLIAYFLIYPYFVCKKIRIPYWKFLRKFSRSLILAFVSCSSSAAFPLVMNELGECKKKKAEMFGSIALILKHANCLQTPIYCIVIAKMVQIRLTIPFIVMSTLMGVLTSIGTAGIPGGGVVMIAVSFKILNLPLEYVAVIAGIYVLLDMPGTMMNVLDDCIGLTLVQKELKIDNS